MAKQKLSSDEKFEKQDFDLFQALAALDKKDYGYFDTLTEEQQSKFSPFMLIQWMSSVNKSSDIQGYYVRSTEYHANKHMFNEYVYKHPKLQWQMLCAVSPGLGTARHSWIPQLGIKVSSLREKANKTDTKTYFQKIYPGVNNNDIEMLSEVFVQEQNKKVYIANNFPALKQDDIDVLSQLITDEDIAQYERDKGN